MIAAGFGVSRPTIAGIVKGAVRPQPLRIAAEIHLGSHLALDPNVHIQEVKAFACDIRPGRRPRGRDRLAMLLEYQRRAGITEHTGTEAS